MKNRRVESAEFAFQAKQAATANAFKTKWSALGRLNSVRACPEPAEGCKPMRFV
jgi:hypothetical protein